LCFYERQFQGKFGYHDSSSITMRNVPSNETKNTRRPDTAAGDKVDQVNEYDIRQSNNK